MDLDETIGTIKSIGKIYFGIMIFSFVVRGYLCAVATDANCTGNVIIDLLYWWFSPLILAGQIGGSIGLILILHWIKNNRQ